MSSVMVVTPFRPKYSRVAFESFATAEGKARVPPRSGDRRKEVIRRVSVLELIPPQDAPAPDALGLGLLQQSTGVALTPRPPLQPVAEDVARRSASETRVSRLPKVLRPVGADTDEPAWLHHQNHFTERQSLLRKGAERHAGDHGVQGAIAQSACEPAALGAPMWSMLAIIDLTRPPTHSRSDR